MYHSILLNHMWHCEQLSVASIGSKNIHCKTGQNRGFISSVSSGPNQPMHKLLEAKHQLQDTCLFSLTGKQNQPLCVSSRALSVLPSTTCSGMLSKLQSPCRTFRLWGWAPGICWKKQSVLLFYCWGGWCYWCGLAFVCLACADTPDLTFVVSVYWGKPEPVLQPDRYPLCSFFHSLDSYAHIHTHLHMLYMLPLTPALYLIVSSNSIWMYLEANRCQSVKVEKILHYT